ncbi:hypothetical protein BX666DRAFT_1882099 [Dichotomocladium elegans]|nr:hypothetical protein BX666DRAFT_1882099 [Dichotomocladium elegans]
MTQSSARRFFRFSRDRQPKKSTPSSPASNGGRALGSPTLADPVVVEHQQDQDNVHGWLMNVPGYREDATRSNSRQYVYSDEPNSVDIVDGDNNSISTDNHRPQLGRPASISSISSADSINLDELIRNNYTEQVDDETDLLNLADLDIDDSTDDFWKMDDITNDDEVINWSPEADHLETASVASYTSSRTAYHSSRLRAPSALSSSPRYSATSSPEGKLMRQRSGSLSSENSMTSQSTITQQYSRFGMTAALHPSESTSNSSRSHSRLSDYSATSSVASSKTASGLPRPKPGSRGASSPTVGSNSHLSITTQNGTGASPSRRMGGDKAPSEFLRSSSRIGTSTQSRLAKRATHVPLPSTRNAPIPQVVTSSKSTGLSTSRLRGVSASSNSALSRPGSRIGNLRSSHIPPPRNITSPEPSGSSARNLRSQSPYGSSNTAAAGNTSSRTVGLRSSSAAGGSNGSIFGGNYNAVNGSSSNSGLDGCSRDVVFLAGWTGKWYAIIYA